MMKASVDALSEALDNLMEIYNAFVKDQVLREIRRYRKHVCATDMIADVVVQEILQFIIKWNFTESLLCTSLILQSFLTICILVS